MNRRNRRAYSSIRRKQVDHTLKHKCPVLLAFARALGDHWPEERSSEMEAKLDPIVPVILDAKRNQRMIIVRKQALVAFGRSIDPGFVSVSPEASSEIISSRVLASMVKISKSEPDIFDRAIDLIHNLARRPNLKEGPSHV